MLESMQRIAAVDRKDVSVKRVIKAIVRRIADIPKTILFFLPLGFYRKNRVAIKSYKDKHKGQRCFIVCNGPSLKDIDFSLLKDEITLGMNRIYLMKDQNGFEPTYLGCVDKNSQILQFYEDLDKLTMPCFFIFNLSNYFSKKDNQLFIKLRFSPKFQKDCSSLLGAGGSVTYSMMQLAFYMGFQEVYIIGKDHSFNTNAAPGTAIKSDGNDVNHFIKGYYKPGMTWDAPHIETEELAYKFTRKAFEGAGRIIKNATIGGKLEVFERVGFYSLFPKKEVQG